MTDEVEPIPDIDLLADPALPDDGSSGIRRCLTCGRDVFTDLIDQMQCDAEQAAAGDARLMYCEDDDCDPSLPPFI